MGKVAEGRGLSLEEVHKIAKGRIWSGEDALQRGLVDQLGGLAEAVQIAKQEANLSQVEYGLWTLACLVAKGVRVSAQMEMLLADNQSCRTH